MALLYAACTLTTTKMTQKYRLFLVFSFISDFHRKFRYTSDYLNVERVHGSMNTQHKFNFDYYDNYMLRYVVIVAITHCYLQH
jgi:hypothetical protein